MDIWGCIVRISLISALVAFLAKNASSLKCYECSTITDEKCGSTWQLSEDEAEKYLVNCTGDTVSCVKYVGEWKGDNIQRVYRYCRNLTQDVEYNPAYCSEHDVRGSSMCRCKTDACNAQGRTEAGGLLLVLAFLACVFHHIH